MWRIGIRTAQGTARATPDLSGPLCLDRHKAVHAKSRDKREHAPTNRSDRPLRTITNSPYEYARPRRAPVSFVFWQPYTPPGPTRHHQSPDKRDSPVRRLCVLWKKLMDGGTPRRAMRTSATTLHRITESGIRPPAVCALELDQHLSTAPRTGQPSDENTRLKCGCLVLARLRGDPNLRLCTSRNVTKQVSWCGFELMVPI